MRYRGLALPPEHGGWGLLFEPILVGLIAAPSIAGALIAAAAIAAFLARQPTKIVLNDLLSGRRVPRTTQAAAFAAGYIALAATACALAVGDAGIDLLRPIVAAVPLAAIQIAYDARNRSRAMPAELCGAAALAASAAAIGAAGGRDLASALALWVVAAARTVPAMVAVRTRVMRLHGEPASSTPPMLAHALAVAAGWFLHVGTGLTRAVAAIYALLAARAAFTLRASAPRVRAQRIGIEELVAGLVASAVLGFLAAAH